MNVIVNGAAGRMGQHMCRVLEEAGVTLAAAVDRAGGDGIYTSLTDYTGPADVVIDFSNHASAKELADTFNGDSMLISLLTIAFVFIILLFTFKSVVTIPFGCSWLIPSARLSLLQKWS